MTFYAFFFHLFHKRSSTNTTRRLTKAAKVWGTGLSKILNIKIKVHGDPNAVKGLIVSNHLSYVDILTTATVFPLRFTPKAEIANWPFLGWFIRISKPIWVNRASRQTAKKTLSEFVYTLKNDMNLIIFPEGTTTDGKDGLLPFKSTTFKAAVRAECPVTPILIHYRENEKNLICWYGDLALLTHLWKVFGMKRIDAEVHILETVSHVSTDRKVFAARIHKIMETEYKRLYC